MRNLFKIIQTLLLPILLSACSGLQTFSPFARSGDTAAIAAGWKHDFGRDEITITITPSVGAPIIIPPGDNSIRAVINLYPDPLSSIFISKETGLDFTPSAQTYFNTTNSHTKRDKDWWQTTVFFDLPPGLPVGTAYIDITNDFGETHSSTVEIIDGIGQPNELNAENLGPMYRVYLASLERVNHFVVSFNSAIIPYAIEINLAHDPDMSNGGQGVAYVVNPRGDLKNILWSDDGSALKVFITPTHSNLFTHMNDFKFYVAGGIANLQVVNVVAVDADGNVVQDVNSSITQH